jgi:hypothetical protein
MMILLEYLCWILFLGYCYFVAIRLKWLFEKVAGHPFWQRAKAKNYYMAAGVLLVGGVVLLVWKFHVSFLLLLLLGEYWLISSPAVKVNERGIMINAFLVRWPDVFQARRHKTTGEITILTKHAWQRIRLQVPEDKAAAFRKMLAAKGLPIVDEEVEKFEAQSPATDGENKSSQPPEDFAIKNLA